MGVAVAVAADTSPLEQLGAVGVVAALGNVDLGDRLPAHGVLGDRVGNGLGVDEEGVEVEVVNVVASLVVVDVVRDADLAAEELVLLLRLEDLGSGEETAGRDAVLDERRVVGAARELGRDRVLALGCVEVLEIGLNDVRASRARNVESVA